MGSIVRGKINRGDLALWDGKNATTTRVDATSGTITGLQINDFVDVLQVFGNGTARTLGTVDAAVSYIGSSVATLMFSPGTWTIDDDITIPANLTVVMAAGAVFDVSAGKTLTISGPLILQDDTFSSGSGTVTVSKGGASLVYIEDAGGLFDSSTVEGALAEAIAGNFPQSNSESDASVTPTDYAYPPGYIERYGGTADGTTDNTTALETAQSIGRQATRFWDTGRTDVLNTYTGRHRFYIVRDAFIDRGSLLGPANLTSDGTQTTSILRLGQDPDTSNGAQWRRRSIRDITFSGKQRADTCISFGADAGAEENLAGQWLIDNCQFERPDIGILKQYGNIGNTVRNCNSQSGNFFYHATGQVSGGSSASFMHLGADKFENVWTSGFRKAAYYLDGDQTSGTGQTIWDGCWVEQNGGFGIFIKDYNNSYNPIHMRNVWFEANAADADSYDGTVDLGDGGGAREPRDIYLENVDMCYITNSQFRIIEVIDSNVIFEGCTFVHANVTIVDNSTGTGNNGSPYMIARDCAITNFGDEAAPTLMVESVRRTTTKTSVTLRHWWIPHRTHIVHELPGSGDVTTSNASDSETYEHGPSLNTTLAVSAIVDGLTFPTASQYVMGTSESYTAPAHANITTISGNWFVCTQEIRIDSGELGSLGLVGADVWTRTTADTIPNAHTGEWVTIGVMGQIDSEQSMGNMRYQFTTNSGSACTFTLGACQLVQFSDSQDAYDYFNSGAFYLPVNHQTGAPVTKVKTADENVTTSTTLQDDDHLEGWSLHPSFYYKVTGHLRYTQNVGNIAMTFTFTNTPAEYSMFYDAHSTATSAVDHYQTDETTAETFASLTDTEEVGMTITGFIQANATTGGTVDFQWAQETSSANNTTIREGSWITFERIG